MKVKTLRLGITNCYLLKGKDGYILVDAGSLYQSKRFLSKLNKLKINPHDIKLIIITHAHYDHVGSLAAIKKICNCPVAISPEEGKITEEGRVVIPPGTNWVGKVVSSLGKTFKFILQFPKAEVDYIITEEFPLEDWGIKGKIISTPGHTAGSLSVLLDDGRAIVGDLAMNMPIGKIYPIFAEQPEVVYDSWRELVAREVKHIYPAHGTSFPVTKLTARLK